MRMLFLDILTDDPAKRKKFQREVCGGKPAHHAVHRVVKRRVDDFVVVDAVKGKFPDPSQFDVVIIGGSLMNAVKGEETLWMKKTYAFIRRLIKSGLPLLGICGGMQFTVRALGGTIVYNPKGRNIGTSTVRLTPTGKKDLLFRGHKEALRVQVGHKCLLENMQADWKLLGESSMCPIDAVAIGDNIRLVQFHPELTAKAMRGSVKARKEQLLKEGVVKPGSFTQFLASIENPRRDGRRIIENFLTHFVRS